MAKNKTHHGSSKAAQEERDTFKETLQAASALVVGSHVMLPWYALHAFEERNSRTDSWKNVFSDLDNQLAAVTVDESGEAKERGRTADGLVGPLLNGWDTVQGSLEVTIPTPDETKLAIAQRRATLDGWKVSIDDTFKHIASFVESFWFPGGKPAPISGIVNMGYRRMRAMPAVVYARYVRGIGTAGQYDVPCVVAQYSNALESYMRHVLENLAKDLGRSQYSPTDYVKLARDIVQRGGTESQLRAIGKVGETQRAFALVMIDQRFPQVHLVDRVFAPSLPVDKATQLPYYWPAGSEPDACPKVNDLPLTPGEAERGSPVNYRSMDKEDLRAVLNGYAFGPGATGKVTDRPRSPLTAKTAEAYAHYVTTGGKRPTGWGRGDTKQYLGGNASTFLQTLADLMAEANRDGVKKLTDRYAKTIEESVLAEGFDKTEFLTEIGVKK